MVHRLAVNLLTTTVMLACAAIAAAEPLDVRLRFAWGSGPQAPQQWHGSIAVADGELAQLQRLGIEPDESAALRLAGNELVVSPLIPRAFDGCDISIRADEAAIVTIRLHNTSAAEPRELNVPLSQLATTPYRAPLDDFGGYLLVQRAPGDTLRVAIDRDHLVFNPGEAFKLAVTPDIGSEPEPAALTLEARLRSSYGGAVLWEHSQQLTAADAASLPLELAAPQAEGAYRLSVTLRRPAGFSSKLTPWQAQAPVAARDVEFVVIDPQARLPRITGQWQDVQTIDPTTSKWWQRVPEWTQLDRLPLLTTQRSLGNVKPTVRALAGVAVVELPVAAADADPSWQAYPLAVREVGQPHAVEVTLPAGLVQQLAVSIIEPDAAGRVMSFGREAGVYVDEGLTAAADGAVLPHRVVFWPRTTSPLLLIVNQSTNRPVQFATIRVSRRTTIAADAPGVEPAQEADATNRLVAAYVSLPRWSESLGAAKELDGQTALSVDGWATFLEANSRLAQELRAGGFNAAVLSVASEGSSLAPIAPLGDSPRYDTGLLASSGADPLRKDVLEALLRIFDREGLRVVPALDLAAPLPQLEALSASTDPRVSGHQLVGVDGRSWSQSHPGASNGARYNVLNPDVQANLSAAVQELVERYGAHPSFGGLALQLSGNGYGVLPGLTWGLDDATTSRFAAAAGVELQQTGDDRFRRRAETLLGPNRSAWIAWRQAALTAFYGDVGRRVAAGDPQRQLILCTENLFDGAAATHRIRQALNRRATLDDAAAEIGVDLSALAGSPHICLLRPRRLASDDAIQARALDLLVNNAAEFDSQVEHNPQAGELGFHTARRVRLASFDSQSPWGADKTYLAMNVPSYPTEETWLRPLATSLASRDYFALVEGAESLPLLHSTDMVRIRRLFQELPAGSAEVRVERRQPVTMRVYRSGAATTVCLVNESAWPADLSVPLEDGNPVAWRELGVPAEELTDQATGSLAARGESWRLTLPAYGVAARQFESRSLRVGPVALAPNAMAKAALAARIEDIEQRRRGLDIERPYPQLQNPDFELAGTAGLMLGWQPRMGQLGNVTIDESATVPGARSLHLQSEDALGVAAQSHSFALPSTGQLVMRARIRVSGMAPDARLFVRIESPASIAMQAPYVAVADANSADGWFACEAAFDDLPLVNAGQMRVLFHLAGRGEAWVDDVELFDLRFSHSQRVELAKRLNLAKDWLNEGQIVDCQRLVDGYWPRYLVASLPATAPEAITPAEPAVQIATRPEDAAPAAGDAAPGFGDRVRGALPRIWR